MTPPLIETRGLTRRYEQMEALHGLDLAIGPGELFGLLGPNGAGKTTTLRLIAGLLRPTSGTVSVAGLDPIEDAIEVKRQLGYVPDSPQLLEAMTGLEYVDLVAEAHGLTLAEGRVRRDVLTRRLDLGTALERPMGGYSLGQRKKVALIAALLPGPRVILLDEPTASLDPASTLAVEALLTERVASGAAVLLSTHLLHSAQSLCHRVGIMQRGHLIAVDTPARLIEAARTGKGAAADLTAVFHALTQEA